MPPDAKAQPVAFRAGGFDPRPGRIAPWIAAAAILAGWQIASSTGALPDLFMPSPEAVIKALTRMWASGELTLWCSAPRAIAPG